MQSPYSSGKCKLKQPWDSTLYESEWLRSKSQVTAHGGMKVEKEDHSCIAAVIANWYNQIPQKIGNRSTWRTSYTTFEQITKRCPIMPQGHMFHYVHSSHICDIQKLETNWMYHNARMDSENMVHLHNGILLNYQEWGYHEFCMQMVGTRQYDLE